MKLIKEVVKNNLHRRKINLGEFAELLEITQESLSRIFTKNSTTIPMLEKMAEILGISPGEFFESGKVEEPQAGYTVIKNEELIELQRLALGNIKKELEQSKNTKVVPE